MLESYSGQYSIATSKSYRGEYDMYRFIPLQGDDLCETSLKANVVIDEGKDWHEMQTVNAEMKL